IDSLENGHFAKAGADERLALRQMFNRGDFMRGYAMGAEDAAVIYPERVNHLGVPLGKIERVERGFARFTPLLALHDGDGLQLRAEGAPDQDMIYSGKEIPAGQEALLRLRPDMRVRPGMLVCRLTDARQMAQAALPEPSIAVDMRLTAFPGQPLTLWLSDGESAVTVTGPEAQQARSRALTAEDAARCLEKTGDTCFKVRDIAVETADAFAAVSVLNALRREGLEALRRARIAAHTRQAGRELPDRAYEIHAAPQPPTALCRTPAQLDALPQGVRALYQPEIYTEDNANALSAFLLADSHTNGSRKNILSTLPIYTASNEFLNEFLTERNVSEDEINKILEYADGRKNQILDILKNNDVCDEIPYLSREEFESQPLGLSLSPMFCDKNFEYTYEEYSKHLALTEDFAKSEKNYSVIKTRENAFVNIQVSMHSGEFVMISKNKAPTIHFVIRHPTLRNAIENIDFPVI
ncbi:MAG: DUF3656 domain-containing protein, partial [Clostridiales bacterium]|nr:DUF3656 domain-containing protein [Clostridiales bacterium]